ncbi:hypothetical protein D047_4711B, partial [Vibrio parahaemolyticus VPTS-2010_2]
YILLSNIKIFPFHIVKKRIV